MHHEIQALKAMSVYLEQCNAFVPVYLRLLFHAALASCNW